MEAGAYSEAELSAWAIEDINNLEGAWSYVEEERDRTNKLKKDMAELQEKLDQKEVDLRAETAKRVAAEQREASLEQQVKSLQAELKAAATKPS